MNFTKSVCGRLSLIHNGVELGGLYDHWNPSSTHPRPNTSVKARHKGESLILWNREACVLFYYSAVEVASGFVWEQAP